jgi:fructose-1,6-bisphosphatase/inositol monophosphatase family enzyme
VAAGALDGYLATGPPRHGPWDYLGALLVCREAGVELVDGDGEDLVVLDHGARRAPVAGATPELTAALVDARRRALDP